ncbi:MAG: deacetylase SIR2 [Aerococcus sp.]|nr:deacetylase SIR2 [Aerococcus sp.]
MTQWQALASPDADEATQLKQLMEEADAIVVGTGAGLAAADGFTYQGERFTSHFQDFIEAKGFLDMLQAFVSDDAYDSWEEYWAFKSRFVILNALEQPAGEGHIALRKLLSHKPWHMITTNADNGFYQADYPMDQVFYYQGEYRLLQCSAFCHRSTYRDDALMYRMAAEQQNRRVPHELVPYCPVCGAPLEINKRVWGRGMVESDDWLAQRERYQQFLDIHRSDKVLYLEIGVGNTTPQFIRYPFWQATADNPDAIYVMMNAKHYRVAPTIKARTVRLTGNIHDTLVAAEQLWSRETL